MATPQGMVRYGILEFNVPLDTGDDRLRVIAKNSRNVGFSSTRVLFAAVCTNISDTRLVFVFYTVSYVLLTDLCSLHERLLHGFIRDWKSRVGRITVASHL